MGCTGSTITVYYTEVTKVPEVWPGVAFLHIEPCIRAMDLPRWAALRTLKHLYPGRDLVVPDNLWNWTEGGVTADEWSSLATGAANWRPLTTVRIAANRAGHVYVYGVKPPHVPCRLEFTRPQLNPRLPETATLMLPEGFAETSRFLERLVNKRYFSGTGTVGFTVLDNTKTQTGVREVRVGTETI
jgi:hypothetical protein